MNHTYRYQVIFFGDRTDLFGSIKEVFLAKVKELGLDKDSFVFLTNEEAASQEGYKGNQPAYCVYANSRQDVSQAVLDCIQRQKDEGNEILPIYTIDFPKEINPILSDYNGINYSEGIDSIVNHMLEGFYLLRRRRKLFISYRRADSRPIALQLFEWFESLNYDIFVDTHSVPKGFIFQEQLWHQMSDSDAVILLDTKDFLESEWCAQELTYAESKCIAILRLKFPDSSIPDDNAAIISTLQLTDSSFEGDKLKEDELQRISCEIESIRARALASRQDNLITELIETGRLYSKNIVRYDRNRLVLKLQKNGKEEEYLFIPAIGVPQSMDFHNIDNDSKEILSQAKEVYLIYDDRSLLNSWNNHLKWLNGQLIIHSLSVSDFIEFFKKL